MPIPVPAGVTDLPVPLQKNFQGRYLIADDSALETMRMLVGPMLDTLKGAMDPAATESEADLMTGALLSVLPEELDELKTEAENAVFPLVLAIRFSGESPKFQQYSGLYLFEGALEKWLVKRTKK